MRPTPTRIEPIFSPRLWGARSLAPLFPEKSNLTEPLGEAWLTFLRPSSQYGWLARNRMALGRWLTLWERGLCIELPLPVLLWGQAEVFLALLAGVPAIFAFAVERAVGEPRGSGRAGAFAFAVLMFAGTALVGNTGEVGENNRFRFLVTPLAAAVAAAGAERLRARFRSTR